MADLKGSNFYPCAASKTEFLDTFCLYKSYQDNSYGQRLRSFFRAPETGYFTFQTSCDNSCQLWMSSSELPAGKRLIIDQRVSSKAYSWDGYVYVVQKWLTDHELPQYFINRPLTVKQTNFFRIDWIECDLTVAHFTQSFANACLALLPRLIVHVQKRVMKLPRRYVLRVAPKALCRVMTVQGRQNNNLNVAGKCPFLSGC